MDTKSFDKQSKQHLKTYENVMLAAKICILSIIVTLIIINVNIIIIIIIIIDCYTDQYPHD